MREGRSTAVLLSGGLDSAVLLAEIAQGGADVYPIYVSVGLAWESLERSVVGAFLAQAVLGPHVRPLATLTLDMRDLYPSNHWARTGQAPGYYTADEDVYLPGRNIVLLAKAGLFCAVNEVKRLVIGSLDHNPFPDATPEFRTAMAQALSLGLACGLEIDAPFSALSKAAVIRRGTDLGVPFALTLSCMNPSPLGEPSSPLRPSPARHCGVCSKCRERHDAFLDIGIDDPTDYADRRFVSAGRSGSPSRA